jgi:hypothetical protein
LRFGALLSVAILATIGSTYLEQQPSQSRRLTTSTGSSKYIQKIVASNEYGECKHGSEYPWLSGRLVVEPHKPTTLEVITTEVALPDFTYEWTITDPNGDKSMAKGSTISTLFHQVGKFSISVDVLAKGGSLLGSYNVDANSLFVKRELRKLTEEDRENFLEAMIKIWRYPTSEGREKFGEDFTGMDRFVYIHAREATGDITCDKWHEGSGFLTHHLALGTSLDMALQAIDKRVSIPYWDFTIEGEELSKAGLGPKSFTKYTPILSDMWFGEVDKFDHVINSRWAHTKAVTAATGSKVRTSYGFIRAPWNNNADNEMVRHYSDVCGLEPVNKPVPSCSSHYNVLKGESLPEFLLSIPGGGHGPMHVAFGGVYGECTGAMKRFYNKYADTFDESVSMAQVSEQIKEATGVDHKWGSTAEFTKKAMLEKYVHLEYFHIYRSLYRSQFCAVDGMTDGLQCPESCGLDTPQSECTCTCKGIDSDGTVTDAFDWKNFEPCLYASGTSQALLQNTLSDEIREELVTTMCSSGVKEGEMLESASPLDPIFWMIHPVLDRLLIAKRLSAVSDIEYGNYGKINAFTSEEWLDYSYYTTNEKACEGHSMYDAVLPDLPLPKGMISGFDANEDGELNSIEFYEAVDPLKEEGIFYIYDDFKWEHCDVDNIAVLNDGEMFMHNVEPSKWDGPQFKDLKSDTMTVRRSKPMSQHREEVRNGLKPGKSLKKTERVVGSKADFKSVLDILEANSQ